MPDVGDDMRPCKGEGASVYMYVPADYLGGMRYIQARAGQGRAGQGR